MADALRRALAITRQLGSRNIRIAVQYLGRSSGEANVARRIDAVGEVRANGPHRCAIADSEAHVMDHVAEILRIVLVETERYVTQALVNIAHVMKEHALDILPNKGEAQLDVVNE